MAGCMSKADQAQAESQPSAPKLLYDPPPSYTFTEPRVNRPTGSDIQAGSYNHSTPQQFEPPPSYEESLNHPTVSEYFNQTAGVNSVKPKDQNDEKYRLPKQEKPTVPISYPKQNYPIAYPQQQVNFAVVAPSIPGPFSPPFYPGQQVIIPNAFDEGVRFNSIAPPSIPPPPPGIAPNVAQLAAQHGAQVVTSKKKSSLLTGGKGAGFTFW